MHCASYRRDHVGFARWRERCEDRLADMPPNIRADFYLKQGIGQARFGRYRRAEVQMKEALAIAGAAGLHEFEFRIGRILAGLADCQRTIARETQPATEPVMQTAEPRALGSMSRRFQLGTTCSPAFAVGPSSWRSWIRSCPDRRGRRRSSGSGSCSPRSP